MDIRIQGPGAEQTAQEAVGAVFGDDISTGPLRRGGRVWKAPTKLMAEARNRARVGVLFSVAMHDPLDLRPGRPPSAEIATRIITLHLVNILANGKLVGQAVRMDKTSQLALAEWEANVRRTSH